MLYDIGFAIFSLFYLPTLIFKCKLHGDFAERFGRFGTDKLKALEASRGAIWVQAVSVGEVALCRGLIPALKEKFPGIPIVLSTITRTGNDLANKLFSKDAVIIYFPLDFSFVVKKVAGLVSPKVYIMIETEIWPNFLKEMSRQNVPSILINGRISDRSIAKYRLASPLFKKTLNRISLFCMQSSLDAERIKAIGAPKDRVRITGNMKLDVDIKTDQKALEEFTKNLGLKPAERLFVAGSTHPGEEMIILESFKEVVKDFPDLKLLIAPRHVERADEVKKAVTAMGLEPRTTPARRSLTGEGGNHVFILDKIGYLNFAYSAASVVFIGGSLVEHGGQNPIEPAVFAKPILFGPHMFNFKDVTKLLLSNKGAIQVANKNDIVKYMNQLLKDEDMRDALGRNAKEAVLSGRGATLRNLEAIKRVLK